MWPFMLIAVILQLLQLLNVLPNPWSSKYVIDTELLTWEEAFHYCRMKDTALVYVNGSADPILRDLLTSIIPQLEKDPKFKAHPRSNKNFWVKFNTPLHICNEAKNHTHPSTNSTGLCKEQELQREGTTVRGTTLEGEASNRTAEAVNGSGNLEGRICDFIEINYGEKNGTNTTDNSNTGKSSSGSSSGSGPKNVTAFLVVRNASCDTKMFSVCKKRS